MNTLFKALIVAGIKLIEKKWVAVNNFLKFKGGLSFTKKSLNRAFTALAARLEKQEIQFILQQFILAILNLKLLNSNHELLNQRIISSLGKCQNFC